MSDSFVIGSTEFGVDRASRKIAFLARVDGQIELEIEAAGHEAHFERVSRQEEWSWALYPPFFFIRGFPVSRETAESGASIQIQSRNETFEMNLYMMEYCEVRDVLIQRESIGAVSVAGRVDLWGNEMPFRLYLGA